MRLKPSITKSLIGALVIVLVMSMVMAEEMEPQNETRFLKPHPSANITSDYKNTTRERRLVINSFKDNMIQLMQTIASKLGMDLSQVEEEIPVLEKYERFVEATRNFPSFLEGNDLKESSSKEVIEILLRYLDGDAAVVSSLKTLDKKKAESLLGALFREWYNQEVTLEAAFEILRLNKNVEDFLDSKLINMWEKFGIGYTNPRPTPPLRPMLQVLSKKFGVSDLVKALVVRQATDMESMLGRLYRQQLRVWREDGYQSPRTFFFDQPNLESWDSLGLCVWMDFTLVCAHFNSPTSSLYREEVVRLLALMKIPFEELVKKELEIERLMENWLIQKEVTTEVLKNERLINAELIIKKLRDNESVHKGLLDKELMNRELMMKPFRDKELAYMKWIQKKMMDGGLMEKMYREQLMDKELMNKESIKKEPLNTELMNKEMINKELVIQKLRTREMVKWQMLLQGTPRSDEALNARREMLL